MNQVLIVDDEQAVLDILSKMIKMLGFIPLTAKSAKEALGIFRQKKPGIVLADLNLGGDMDGVALCSRILYEDRTTVVIALSGFFSDYDKAYVLAVGFSDFLAKPINFGELKNAVQWGFQRRTRWINLPQKKQSLN